MTILRTNNRTLKRLLTLYFIVFCSNNIFSQAVLVKEASTNPLDIKFEKWKLPNGLKVIVHEDNSDPLVHVHITYHVGSSRESAG